MMKVPQLDLRRQHAALAVEIGEELMEGLENGRPRSAIDLACSGVERIVEVGIVRLAFAVLRARTFGCPA